MDKEQEIKKNYTLSQEFYLFPTVISAYVLNIKKNNIFNFVKKLKFENEGERNNYCLTSVNEQILDNLNLTELKNKIIFCCNDYLNEKNKLNIDFKINNSWGSLTKPGYSSDRHMHSHSFISGVFYPCVEELTSITFHNEKKNNFWNIKPSEYNVHNSDCWKIDVMTNTLLLFKSHVLHEIKQHMGNKNRYSIAFNVIPKNFKGNKTSRIDL